MQRLRAMELFVLLSDHQNLASAGRALGLSAPSASRILRDLEAWVGQPLVVRTTRHVSLTETGNRLLPLFVDMTETLKKVQEAIKQEAEGPFGLLRISVPRMLSQGMVAAIIPDFLAKYPDVQIDLDVQDKLVDILDEKFDMALRIGDIKDSSLVTRKVGTTRVILTASPDFINRRGVPKSLEDLLRLPCLVDTTPRFGAKWPILGKRQLKHQVSANDGETIRTLAIAGLGVAYLPEPFVSEAIQRNELVEILPELTHHIVDIRVVFPPKEFINPAARAFAEALALERF